METNGIQYTDYSIYINTNLLNTQNFCPTIFQKKNIISKNVIGKCSSVALEVTVGAVFNFPSLSYPIDIYNLHRLLHDYRLQKQSI